MIFVFATICLGSFCHDELVTSSKFDPSIGMQWCVTAAAPQLAAWMAENWPSYRLAGWRCQLGERAKASRNSHRQAG